MTEDCYKILDWFWIAEDLHIRAILTTQSKRWYLQWQQPGSGKGRQRRKSLGTSSKKEAGIRGARFARSFEAGQIPTNSLQSVTIDKVVALKLERLESDRAAANTKRLYNWYFRMLAAYLPRHGQTSVTMLSPLMLTDFAKKLRTVGIAVQSDSPSRRKLKPLSPRAVREVLKAVRGLIHLAKTFKLIATDPSEGYTLPKGTSQEVEVFSGAELHHIFGDPIMGEVWRLLAHTALRLEEFCWLTKADVIVNGQGQPIALHIRHKVCPLTGVAWSPKHGIVRMVPLTSVAAAVITKVLATSPGSWLFEAPATDYKPAGKWPGPRVRAALKKRLETGRITHGTPHVFRHTCASFLANSVGVPVTKLQRFLGHRSLESTMIYLHSKNDDVAQALAAADFSGLATPPAIPMVSQVPALPASGDIPATDEAASTKETPAKSDKTPDAKEAPK